MRLAFRITLIILVLATATSGCGKSTPPANPTANLTFNITPPQDFVEFGATERTKTYTFRGKALRPGDSVLILTRSSKVFDKDKVRRETPGVFIKEMQDRRDLSNVNNIVTSPTVATQLPGYQATADALADGVAVKVYCAKFFSTDCTYTVFGYVAGDKATMIDSFKTSANSLIFK